jgi:probable HAF family extracellular repeat protein
MLSACRHEDDAHDSPGRASFTALGVIQGYASSDAAALSSDGSVIVGTSTSATGIRQAFRWTVPQGMVGIGFLAQGTSSSAKGVSGDGSVVVGDADGGAPGLHVFRWTVDLGLVALAPLRDSNLCSGGGVSRDGDTVVGTCLAPLSEAFRWTSQAGTVGLGRFGTGSNATSAASAISADGHVVGGAGHVVLAGAVIWNLDNTATIIGNPPVVPALG